MHHVPLIRRFAAVLVDWIAATLVSTLVTGDSWTTVNPFITLGIFVVMVAVPLGLGGLTLGKALAGLVVIGPDGHPIGVLRALFRTAMLCLVIPAFAQAPDGRGLHDVAANCHQQLRS